MHGTCNDDNGRLEEEDEEEEDEDEEQQLPTTTTSPSVDHLVKEPLKEKNIFPSEMIETTSRA